MEKFWTTQNGVLGTAHISRSGEIVDFRAGEVLAATGQLVVLNGEVRVGPDQLVVYPPKGQKLESIRLDPVRTEKRVDKIDHPNRGQHMIATILYAQYLGVEISAVTDYSQEWYDLEEKARVFLEWEAKREEERKSLESFPDEEIINKVSSREIGRLRAGTKKIEEVIEKILREAFEKRFSKIDVYCQVSAEISRRNLGGCFLSRLFAADDQRREERKRQWLKGI